jgi:hypothetical protein
MAGCRFDYEAYPSTGLFCQVLEAESGVLTPPMEAGADPLASNGAYVSALQPHQGSVRFAFQVPEPGQHVLQVRVLTVPPVAYCDSQGSCNSFFVGMDDEPAENNESYVFSAVIEPTFTWDTVNRIGSCDLTCNEFDPMTWELAAGSHTVTVYGREPFGRVDQVVLRRCPQDGGCGAVTDFGCGGQGP